MHGFTESDIRLQKDTLDRFIKHQKPQCLSELQSILLLDDKETPQSSNAASDLADTSSAVRSQMSVSHRLSKKCIDKASFVKRQYCSGLSQLKQRHTYKHETTKLSGKSVCHSVIAFSLKVNVEFLQFVVHGVHFVVFLNNCELCFCSSKHRTIQYENER